MLASFVLKGHIFLTTNATLLQDLCLGCPTSKCLGTTCPRGCTRHTGKMSHQHCVARCGSIISPHCTVHTHPSVDFTTDVPAHSPGLTGSSQPCFTTTLGSRKQHPEEEPGDWLQLQPEQFWKWLLDEGWESYTLIPHGSWAASWDSPGVYVICSLELCFKNIQQLTIQWVLSVKCVFRLNSEMYCRYSRDFFV